MNLLSTSLDAQNDIYVIEEVTNENELSSCVPEASQNLIDIEISVEKGSNSSLKVHIRVYFIRLLYFLFVNIKLCR